MWSKMQKLNFGVIEKSKVKFMNIVIIIITNNYIPCFILLLTDI